MRESSFLSSFLANASCLSCFLISRVFGLFIGNVLLSRIQRLLLVCYRGFDLRPLLAAFGLFISLSPLRVPSFLGLFPSPSWCPWSQTSPLTFLCQSFLENKGRRCLNLQAALSFPPPARRLWRFSSSGGNAAFRSCSQTGPAGSVHSGVSGRYEWLLVTFSATFLTTRRCLMAVVTNPRHHGNSTKHFRSRLQSSSFLVIWDFT